MWHLSNELQKHVVWVRKRSPAGSPPITFVGGWISSIFKRPSFAYPSWTPTNLRQKSTHLPLFKEKWSKKKKRKNTSLKKKLKIMFKFTSPLHFQKFSLTLFLAKPPFCLGPQRCLLSLFFSEIVSDGFDSTLGGSRHEIHEVCFQLMMPLLHGSTTFSHAVDGRSHPGRRRFNEDGVRRVTRKH